MGRRKLDMKKIEDSAALQVTYTKRRDGILKKANELSVLCGIDVGLVMFSPGARLTKFSSNGRIEDIFLRYISQRDDSQEPLENEEHLVQRLVHSKCEGEMLDMIAKKEALEEKLIELTQQQLEAKEKLGFYQPEVEEITSIHDAHIHEKHLIDAIQHVEKLRDELLGKNGASRTPESAVQQAGVCIMDTNFTTEETARSKRKRNPSSRENRQAETSSAANRQAETSSAAGLHPNIEYLDHPRQWIVESGGPIID